jgi:hypothetical protein
MECCAEKVLQNCKLTTNQYKNMDNLMIWLPLAENCVI